MNIKLTKPLIFFDLETTGISISKDRICQIAFTKFFPQIEGQEAKEPISKKRIINPEMIIPKGAIDIHGISNEDAKKAATFDQIAKSLFVFFEGCDIAGYNNKRFDIPMLREHFLRCDIDFPSPKASIIDVFKIVQEVMPRNLSAMYELMTGNSASHAHDAEYDNMMCVEVFSALINPKSKFKIEPYITMKGLDTIEDLHDFCASHESTVDYARRIVINEKTEEYEWNFGKHKGERVLGNKSYALWVLANDFTEDTKDHLLKIWKRAKKEL